MANYRQIEKILKGTGPKQRATIIKQNDLSGKFDEDGFLRDDFLRALGENVVGEDMDAQRENEAHGASTGATVGKTAGKTDFSLKNGVVHIDTDQEIFEGVEKENVGRVVRDYMKQRFRGTTVASQYVGFEVSADMIRNDTDGVATALGVVDFVNGLVTDGKAAATEKEFYRLVAEERAVNAESGADFDEAAKTQVFRVGENVVPIMRQEAEDGGVSYTVGRGADLSHLEIAKGVSAEKVRALMDRMIGAENAAKQQTADDLTNVQGAAAPTVAEGMAEGAAGASPRPTTANSAVSGAAIGQGAALADGATNGQGASQNATEDEKTGSARTKDIRAEYGRQYEAVKRKSRHSVEEARTMQFSEKAVTIALWEAMDHHDAGDDNLILVSKMPQYIVDLLGIEGDFYIYRNHAYENMASREDAVADGRPVTRHGNDIHFHDLGIEKMTEAILSIEHPTLTIAERGKDGNPEIVMMLNVNGNNGAPLYAAIRFYANTEINGSFEKKPHVLLTIAERGILDQEGYDGWEGVINNAMKEKRIIDMDRDLLNNFYGTLEKEKRTSGTVNGSHTRATIISESSLKNSLAEFKKFVKQFREKNKINYAVPSSDTSNQQTSADNEGGEFENKNGEFENENAKFENKNTENENDAEARRRARQEQEALACEAWEMSQANREGKQQLQYLIEFQEKKTPGQSNTATKDLLRSDQASYGNSIAQKSKKSTPKAQHSVGNPENELRLADLMGNDKPKAEQKTVRKETARERDLRQRNVRQATEIKALRTERKQLKAENVKKERAFRNAKFLAEMVTKRDYMSSSMLENEDMKEAIKPLTKIKSVYQLKKNGGEIRRIVRDFGVAFYNSKNDISVGENGNISTVYDVGKIKKDTLPSGKIVSTFSGSKANNASFGNSISRNKKKSRKKLHISWRGKFRGQMKVDGS